jgi:UDP-N-acetylmuramate dehydrogenase
MPAAIPMPLLREKFGSALQENVSLANYTTARTGGLVAALLPVHSAAELEQAALVLWALETPFQILGSGSNVLVSEAGLDGIVVLNRARNIKVDTHHEPPSVWAESGANFGTIARQAALRGLSGLEWAATIPGTLGGAVYGNAGAYGGDMQGNLIVADILHRTGKEAWTADQMAYAYRSSALKRSGKTSAPDAIILSARLRLDHADPKTVQAVMEKNSEHRRRTQPPGASMGSMFKNPPGDYAGRLIEAAGLKGARIGDAEISGVHANFFINHGQASAADIGQLIAQARRTVFEKFGVLLELEIELLGDWPVVQIDASGSLME